MKTLSDRQEIADMARGASFLGAGGGGDPYLGKLYLGRQIALGRVPMIVDVTEIPADGLVVCMGAIGAPTVLVESLISTKTVQRLFAKAESFFGRRPDAIISAEIGGLNSMLPLAIGAEVGVPVVDGDGIGRAFPRTEMSTFSIYGCRSSPCFVVDDFGTTVTFEAANDRLIENLSRPVASVMGAMVLGAFYPMSGADAVRVAVRGTISQTIAIGRAIREARDSYEDPVHGLLEFLHRPDLDRHAIRLFDGKIVDVSHQTRDGWHFGRVVLEGSSEPGTRFEIDFQNEYLVARRSGRTVAIVPDLIVVVEAETAEPLTAEMLSYGQRVKVLGYSADPMLRTPAALAVCGPRAFGIDENFHNIAQLREQG
jgi:uncharacterized protein